MSLLHWDREDNSPAFCYSFLVLFIVYCNDFSLLFYILTVANMSKAHVVEVQAEPMIVSGKLQPCLGDGEVVYIPPNKTVASV